MRTSPLFELLHERRSLTMVRVVEQLVAAGTRTRLAKTLGGNSSPVNLGLGRTHPAVSQSAVAAVQALPYRRRCLPSSHVSNSPTMERRPR